MEKNSGGLANMVITPQQARQLTQQDKAKLRSLEERIDASLIDGNFCISIGYVKEKVLTELKKRYTQAGLQVKYESDQRDGDYLRFEKQGGYEDDNYK
jgi:hypothetical protein